MHYIHYFKSQDIHICGYRTIIATIYIKIKYEFNCGLVSGHPQATPGVLQGTLS